MDEIVKLIRKIFIHVENCSESYNFHEKKDGVNSEAAKKDMRILVDLAFMLRINSHLVNDGGKNVFKSRI